MTVTTQQIEKAASREATDWLVLLQDDPDDVPLQDAFREWLERSPVNAAAWQAMTQGVTINGCRNAGSCRQMDAVA